MLIGTTSFQLSVGFLHMLSLCCHGIFRGQTTIYRGFHSHGGIQKWLVYLLVDTICKWMRTGNPHIPRFFPILAMTVVQKNMIAKLIRIVQPKVLPLQYLNWLPCIMSILKSQFQRISPENMASYRCFFGGPDILQNLASNTIFSPEKYDAVITRGQTTIFWCAIGMIWGWFTTGFWFTKILIVNGKYR